ncbi:MAG TPA: hypothetical protein VLU46_02345 [Thermoanaerobaculia bacterium]|nr:hypothetical protein [Thermoanaerobaculia bacterium]
MNHDTRRITLISRPPQLPERDWDRSAEASSRLVMIDSFTVLRYAVAKPLADLDVDVARIVLDRSSSASEYLALLAALPHQFTGDALLIRDDESGFLSSTGRGGDRVLYALSAHDLQFYLEANGLVVPSGAMLAASKQRPVIQFPRRVAVA